MMFLLLRSRIERLRAALARRHILSAPNEDGILDGDPKARARMLGTLSHEFRTPLSGILGMADLLLDTPLAPSQATYVRAIKTSGEALMAFVEEVLDLARLDAGKLQLRPAEVDLVELVESVVELIAPRAQAKGLDIAAHVAPGVPCKVMADEARLRQILLNLAGNAIKFTDRGGIGIRIERTGTGIRIAVLDTGIGIAADKLPALFREFDRAGAEDSRTGAGLGLAITRRIVAAMAGDIAVDSAPGKGSSFVVTLPLEATAGSAEVAPGALDGLRVLVAGASPFEAPWLAETLADAQARVSLATNPEEAQLRIAAERPQAVLIDRAFGPALFPLVERAKAAGAQQVIAMLAPGERSELPLLEQAGIDGWLIKPVRPRSLLARLGGEPSAEESPPQAAAGAVPAASARPLKVLLAEDDEVNALLARTLLARLGHRAERVNDGDSAAAAFAAAARSDPFDLVLLDLRMPGSDGLAAARRLREEETRTGLGRAKILALSANAFDEDRAAAQAAGMDGFLTKPLTAEALQAALPGAAAAEPIARAS